MTTTSRLIISSAAVLAMTATAVLPAFADTNTNENSAVSSMPTSVSGHTIMQVHPTPLPPVSIDTRISLLKGLLARVQSSSMNSITSARVVSAIEAQISKLEALKASGQTTITPGTVSGAPRTGTSGPAVSSNGALGNGAYFSLASRAAITTAANHILAVAGQLENLSVKLEARISSATNVDSASLSSTLADMKAKIADAKTNANAALADVSGLDDSADASTSTSVAASLKDAAAKINAARADITAAYKDAMAIFMAIHTTGLTPTTNSSANTTGNAQ